MVKFVSQMCINNRDAIGAKSHDGSATAQHSTVFPSRSKSRESRRDGEQESGRAGRAGRAGEMESRRAREQEEQERWRAGEMEVLLEQGEDKHLREMSACLLYASTNLYYRD